jgi:hypothetical protein
MFYFFRTNFRPYKRSCAQFWAKKTSQSPYVAQLGRNPHPRAFQNWSAETADTMRFKISLC